MQIVAGLLRVELDTAGRIVALTDAKSGVNRMHTAETSDLLAIRLHGDDRRLRPVRIERLAESSPEDGMRLRLSYDGGVSVVLDVINRGRHTRMTLVAVRDTSGANPVAAAFWGPYVTDMTGAPGEFIGLLRANGFSMGLLSLEPNTDGAVVKGVSQYEVRMARYIEDGSGSCLEAQACDHTRAGVGENAITIRGEPGLTVVGSAVAIFGCATDDELDVIEAIETAEDLPHPMFEGTWIKRSAATLKPSVWIPFNERNVTDCIETARRMDALALCAFHDMFGNWGHFDPDPRLWPSGMAGIREAARKAQAAGVRVVMYTLTTFIKPHPWPEPYVGPAPDDRLQTMGPPTALAADLGAEDVVLALEKRPGLAEALRIAFEFGSWIERYKENQVVRVGNEIIYYRSVREEGDRLIIEGCRRGTFDTQAVPHPRGTRAVRLFLNIFRNFFPGTLDMQDEVADNIARVALEGEFGQITFDGHESCFDTGHGIYSRNRLTKRVYDRCGERIPLYTGSNLGNYDWHVLSFIRWGEWDLEKGFRGTMLDYRIMRQVQHGRNRMPHGLGQYYPSDATLEDVEWLMARAAGWDAAVDFHIFPEVFARNPERDAILDAVRLWNQAQIEGVFNEAQKRELRQTDRLYSLARGADGKWALTFKGRWRHASVEILPSAAFTVEPASPGASVAPCSIDWSWTHNPAIFAKAGLSADLVGRGDAAWTVTYPAADREGTDSLQFVLRLAADAPCAVRNPRISVDGKLAFIIPAVLQPGQYLSTVHDSPMAFLYDAAHEVIGEAHVIGCLCNLPAIARGQAHRIGLSVEPPAQDGAVMLTLNLRTHEQIKPPPAGGQTEQKLADINVCKE